MTGELSPKQVDYDIENQKALNHYNIQEIIQAYHGVVPSAPPPPSGKQ